MKAHYAISVALLFALGCTTKTTIPTQKGFISANGVQLFYKAMGRGDPVIIVHGGPGFDHHHMLPFSALAERNKVIFYDQRTTGDSTGTPNANSITLANFAEDLEQLRQNLNLDKVTLIAHSWGSALAMHYAIRYPQNLDKLVLMSASAGADVLPEYFENVSRRTTLEDSAAIIDIRKSKAFRERRTDAVRKYFRITVKPLFHDPAKVRNLNLTFGKNTAKHQGLVTRLLTEDTAGLNILDKLPTITCPTLIVHGASDPLPPRAAYQIHKALADSRLVILPNTGHFIFAESPDRLMPIVKAFLEDPDSVTDSIPPEIQRRFDLTDR